MPVGRVSTFHGAMSDPLLRHFGGPFPGRRIACPTSGGLMPVQHLPVVFDHPACDYIPTKLLRSGQSLLAHPPPQRLVSEELNQSFSQGVALPRGEKEPL